MRYKSSIAVTLVLTVVSVVAIFYEISTSPPAGRQDREAKKMFRLQEIEPSEPYLELVEPLDEWTARAIQNTTQCVTVREPYWNQCQLISSNATIFKYGERFYNFTRGISTSRHVYFHADPVRETGCGIAISLGKIPYLPERPCYELRDPLDPWTEIALQDPINIVWVDDIYCDDCAVLKELTSKTLRQKPIFKYHDEYYAFGFFGFYDDFSPRVPVEEILVLAWLALGVLWLGSGVRILLKETRRGKSKEKTRELP